MFTRAVRGLAHRLERLGTQQRAAVARGRAGGVNDGTDAELAIDLGDHARPSSFISRMAASNAVEVSAMMSSVWQVPTSAAAAVEVHALQDRAPAAAPGSARRAWRRAAASRSVHRLVRAVARRRVGAEEELPVAVLAVDLPGRRLARQDLVHAVAQLGRLLRWRSGWPGRRPPWRAWRRPPPPTSGLALNVPGWAILARRFSSGRPWWRDTRRTSARPATAPPGSPPARIFAIVVRSGLTPSIVLRAARRDAEARDHLVEDQQRARAARLLAERRHEGRRRRHRRRSGRPSAR